MINAEWIYTKDRVPEDTGTAYQVIAVTKKPMGGNYEGYYKRGFYQDWVLRQWPNNYIAWMPAPPQIRIIENS